MNVAGQLSLLVRNNDPVPSRDAAAVAARRAPAVRRLVLDAVRQLHDRTGEGATADEVTAWLDGRVQRNSVSKRLGELATAGDLVVAGFRRRSPSGVMVTVYLPP